jgi:hypothetical protein
MPRKTRTLLERFSGKYEIGEAGCWLWTAALDSNGYSKLATTDGKWDRAHRISYRLFVGPVPDGMEIDHVCRVRRCVNPEHLEAVLPAQNKLRGLGLPARNARKRRCVRGHLFTPENTYVRKDGGRTCLTCKRVAARETRRRLYHADLEKSRAYQREYARKRRAASRAPN